MDPRYTQLAQQLITYCVDLQKDEVVLIDLIDIPDDFGIALARAAREKGGIPILESRRSKLVRETLRGATLKQAELIRDLEMNRMRQVQAYIAMRGSLNANENADVPSEQMGMYMKTLRPVQNYRVNETKWVVLRWPSSSMAQAANMSTEAFEDFYFRVCGMDYEKMSKAMTPLEKRMSTADQVRLTGPGTDISFSIKGIGAKACNGKLNVPDGEVFSCPVKESVNGVIQFNTPSLYQGTRFENVRLRFENGKVVEASANQTDKLNEILDTDEGSRYIGEFALGFNPHILNPMCDILFDEKIAGSLHFTPGQAYEIADNGNRSAVHWDMVLIQRPEWGGGEVYFDGELIRKDGLFVTEDLKDLNPENLLS